MNLELFKVIGNIGLGVFLAVGMSIFLKQLINQIIQENIKREERIIAENSKREERLVYVIEGNLKAVAIKLEQHDNGVITKFHTLADNMDRMARAIERVADRLKDDPRKKHLIS